jgi:CRP/FNR family cyclic AMP-dependent transcriptional regulator
MLELEKSAFDAGAYLASAGSGRRIVKLRGEQTFFSQGEAADAVFYLQSGCAKLTVVSKYGKEATITLLSAGEFIGEESLASAEALHKSSSTSITDCTALKIERQEMIRVLHEEHFFSKLFIKFLLARGERLQTNLVDQFFDSSERRLACTLLVIAKFGEPDESEWLNPEVSEEALAEMIGAPLSSVNFFMNRFRELGLIEHDGRIRVHHALLNMILHDQLPGDNTAKPAIINIPRRQQKPAKRTLIQHPIH